MTDDELKADMEAIVDMMMARDRKPQDLFAVCVYGIVGFHNACDSVDRNTVEQAVRLLLVKLYEKSAQKAEARP